MSTAVHILDRREFENYLLDADAVAAVLASFDADDSAAPTAAEVDNAMNTAAEDLREAIVVNRVARQLTVVRLMDHKLR